MITIPNKVFTKYIYTVQKQMLSQRQLATNVANVSE